LLLLLLLQGTMSHMAPEALLHGRISKAGDVYAYGITLWELFTGGQAYQGELKRCMFGSTMIRRLKKPVTLYGTFDVSCSICALPALLHTCKLCCCCCCSLLLLLQAFLELL
jgi:hypothetical protein